jgi:hypothetical protein
MNFWRPSLPPFRASVFVMLSLVASPALAQSVGDTWGCPEDVAKKLWLQEVGSFGTGKVGRGLTIQSTRITSAGECKAKVTVNYTTRAFMSISDEDAGTALRQYLGQLGRACSDAGRSCRKAVEDRAQEARDAERAAQAAREEEARRQQEEAERAREVADASWKPLEGVWSEMDGSGRVVRQIEFSGFGQSKFMKINSYGSSQTFGVVLDDATSGDRVVLQPDQATSFLVAMAGVADLWPITISVGSGTITIDSERYVRADRAVGLYDFHASAEKKREVCVGVCQDELRKCEDQWGGHPSCKSNWYQCTSRCNF